MRMWHLSRWFRQTTVRLMMVTAVTGWVAGRTGVASADETQLQAIGSLAAAHVYTSYGYIGVTADSFVSKTLTAKQVAELMNEVNDMLNMNIEALGRVSSTVHGDDKEFVDDLTKIYQLVKKESAALARYAKTEKSEDAAAFEKIRKAIWPPLKQTLGIE